MPPTRALTSAVFASLVLILNSSPASACSCARPADAATALTTAHTVFEGRVVQINPENAQAAQPSAAVVESEGSNLNVSDQVRQAEGLPGGWMPPQMLYRFEVLRSWKGNPAKLVTIETNRQGTACGRTYKKGQAYLLYANAGTEDRLADNACTRNMPSSQASEDFATLDAITATSSPPSQAATTDTQPPGPTEQAPPATPPKAPDATGAIDPVESGPTCSYSAIEGASHAPSSLLLLLLAGIIFYRRQRL